MLNTARPIAYGGTGGTSVITGWDGLAVQGSDIASAGTISLTTATGPSIDITGTTTVTAVTLAAGSERTARATGAFRLTASASLIVNGSTTASYTTTAGDLLRFQGYGSSVVRVWVISTPLYGLTSYPPGTLYGLTLSNDAGDTTNDIGFAVGSLRDGADSANMDWVSAYVKQIDALWAVGSAAGGRDTGSTADGTWFIWGIKRPDTGVTDFLFSLSSSAPTMPTNYTIKRVFGVVVRSGGVNGVPFLFSGPVGTRGQIPFPATQNPSSDPNTNDDYREGTTTPTVTPNAGSFTTVSCALKYTKNGNSVVISGSITVTTIGTAAGFYNVPLPFTCGSVGGSGSANIGSGSSGWTFVGAGSATMLVGKYDVTTPGGSLNFSIEYKV